jgi:hypothetical protein
VDNPAITLNMDDLTATLDSIGKPVRAFLEQQPLISGVVIPEDAEVTTDPPDPTCGSAMIGATPILLVLGTFFNVMI